MKKSHKRQSDKPEREPLPKAQRLTRKQRHIIAKEKAEEEERKRQERENDKKKALEKKKAGKQPQSSCKSHKGKGSGNFVVRNPNGKEKLSTERSTRSVSFVEPVGPPPKLYKNEKSRRGKHDDDQPSTSRASRDQLSTSSDSREPSSDQPSTSRASRDQHSTSSPSSDQPSTSRASRDRPTSRARRFRHNEDQSDQPTRAGLAYQADEKRQNEASKPEVTIVPTTPEVRDNQLQITSITPVRPGSIKPKKEFEPKVTEGRCSLMEQLSSGVKVADLKLPPGITLTRVPASHVQAQQQSKDALKSVPVWNSDKLPVAPTPLPQPQPVINADPSMMIISPARPEPIIAELQPLPLPVPPQLPRTAPTEVPRIGKKKKSKKRSGKKNSSPDENSNGHSVNLFSPVYASTAGVNSNETLKLILNPDIPASLHPIPGGLVNIKNAKITHLNEESVAKMREIAEKATGTINAEPPRPVPNTISPAQQARSYAGATKSEDATLLTKPIDNLTAYPGVIPASNLAATAAVSPAAIPIATTAGETTDTSCPIIISPRKTSILDIPIDSSFSIFSTPEELAEKNKDLHNSNGNVSYEEPKPFQDEIMTYINNYDRFQNGDMTADPDGTYLLNTEMTCHHDIQFQFQNKANIGHHDRDTGLEDSEPFPMTEELYVADQSYVAQYPIGPTVRHGGNVIFQNTANIGPHDRDTGLEDSEPFPMTEELDAANRSYAAQHPIGPSVRRSGHIEFQTNSIIGHQDSVTGLVDSEPYPIAEQLEAAEYSYVTDPSQKYIMTGCHDNTNLLKQENMTAPNNIADLLMIGDMTGRHNGAFLPRNSVVIPPNNHTNLFLNDVMTAPNYGADLSHNIEMLSCHNGTDLLQNDRMTAPKGGANNLPNDEIAGRHDGAFQPRYIDVTPSNYGMDLPQNDEPPSCQVQLSHSNGRTKDLWTLPYNKKLSEFISTISPLIEPANHLSLMPSIPGRPFTCPSVTPPNSGKSNLMHRPNDRGAGISIVEIREHRESNNLAPLQGYGPAYPMSDMGQFAGKEGQIPNNQPTLEASARNLNKHTGPMSGKEARVLANESKLSNNTASVREHFAGNAQCLPDDYAGNDSQVYGRRAEMSSDYAVHVSGNVSG